MYRYAASAMQPPGGWAPISAGGAFVRRHSSRALLGLLGHTQVLLEMRQRLRRCLRLAALSRPPPQRPALAQSRLVLPK
jgi:hypothetical protein